MRAAFIPALPPSALMGGMIAPSFRLVNRFPEKSCFARSAAVRAAARAVRIMGLVAARSLLLRTCGRRERLPALCALWAWSPLACGWVPSPPYARCGMGRLCGERRRRERCERPQGARNAARGTRRLSPPGHAPAHRPAEAPPRAPAPAAVGASPRPPLAPWVRFAPVPPHASVSSARREQETRHVPPPRSLRRANRPHQPSEVWRAAALQVKSYRPAPPGGRGVCAPRRKHSLHVSPAAPKAQGKRAPPAEKIANGELFRRPPSGGAFPTPL